jgi:hypothetical protein
VLPSFGKRCQEDIEQLCYRQEFEAKRGLLKALLVHSVPDLLAALPLIWRYATEDWLRLTIPSATDSTQSRYANYASQH